MKQIRAPFRSMTHGPAVVWPDFSGPSVQPRRHERPREVWEHSIDMETFAGELVLEDLYGIVDVDDALLVLARYLTVRLARNAERGQATGAAFDRAAAIRYLDAIEGRVQERRWLRAVLDSIVGPEGLGRSTVARMNAAATAASNGGHVHGAHALHVTAYALATTRGWHTEAARIATAIAGAAGRAGGRHSQRLWSRRARVHRRRAES